jgi:tRNA-Thr(GGU) m(6)t(6)A37 methyltransferase TsaA
MDLQKVRQRLRRVCLELPEAGEVEAWGDPTYRVRNKIFAMEKGAGTEVWFKGAPGMQQALVGSDPASYFVPPYVGHKGWLGARLDADLDWEELADLIEQSYRLIAPKTLAAKLNSAEVEPPAIMADSPPSQSYALQPIGWVESSLVDLLTAPRQGDEGAPDAWLVFAPEVAAGLDHLMPGADIVVLTWLHRANREVLVVRPRSDVTRPEQGVFSTRSPHRPNPIGLHRVTILSIDKTRMKVSNLEAVDGTPILDIKPVLDPVGER